MLVAFDTPEPVERFAARDLGLHIYELGDLDPFFWPRTRFWGWVEPGDREPSAIALLYDGGDPPTLLALARDDGGAAARLLNALRDRLPARCYAHLSPGLLEPLAMRFVDELHGRHHKMLLVDPSALDTVATEDVQRLGEDDLADLCTLYERAYPGNWFDARMLQTGEYHGIRDGDRIVAVAGVHVFSPRYRVAALGNITTDPDHRGRGLARRTTAALCRSLRSCIDAIGLNVLADNTAAIRCYDGLGFETIADYDEVMLTAR
jgi:ribosomal protein S18 acetylase RimI-like enzyme